MGFIWMGGGHEAFKLGVPVDAFLACFKPWVLDCSTARDEREWDTPTGAVEAGEGGEGQGAEG